MNWLTKPTQVEDVKTVLLKTLKTGYEIAVTFGDGLQLLPDLSKLLSILPDITEVVFRAPFALQQLKSYTPAYADEVTAYIAQNFDISNDDVEAKIEKAVELINKTYKEVLGDITVAQEWIAYANSFKKAA